MIVLQIVFWLLVILILHSYVIYPLLLTVLSSGRKENALVYNQNELPSIDILLAVYNEEKVIIEKIESTFNTSYPLEKINFYIGSDESNDKTDELIRQYLEKYPQLKFKRFSKTGKVGIINELSDISESSIIILTDANVFFQKDTLYHLLKQFANPEIGLVGGNIYDGRLRGNGISLQESYYQKRENIIKYKEGLWGGVMMGAFGGCYAVRRGCFSKVPLHFLVDDFNITMNVIKKGYKAIFENKAFAYEDVSIKISEEFRRKARISAGNFQNLKTFASMLWPPFSKISFAFFSHKVLRWITPFMLLAIYIINIFLLNQHGFYLFLFLIQTILFLIPLVDWLLKYFNINLKFVRFITHFYGMNFALFAGFFRYVMGVKTSVWKPTERNQK